MKVGDAQRLPVPECTLLSKASVKSQKHFSRLCSMNSEENQVIIYIPGQNCTDLEIEIKWNRTGEVEEKKTNGLHKNEV